MSIHRFPLVLRALVSAAAILGVAQNAWADPAASALPTGGKVTAGSATIAQSANHMEVKQNSLRAVIDWQNFDIGSDASVNFNQPGKTAVILNRITSQSPSQILGAMTANGQVFILNPSGVVFGRSAQVNVGGLVASTMALGNSDFMAGRYKFSRSGSTGSIVNQGTLATNAANGYIALLAPELRNEGLIQANLGSVVLAGGEAVTLQIGNRVSAKVDPAAVQTLIDNRAMIMADGGRVLLSSKALDTLMAGTINMSGVIEADSLTTKGGEVVLGASGASTVSGKITATGTTGGSVAVKGDAVTLAGATVDASGTKGGGTIDIGDWNAQSTSVDAASTLAASATQKGNGGTVNAIGQTSTFNGTASARGGAAGGHGGNIETSGKVLQVGGAARVDAGAAMGKAGLWLLDPQDLTIDSAGATALATALATSNVSLTTSSCNTTYGTCTGSNGDIEIASSISPVVTQSGGTTLYLAASRNISLDDNVSISALGGSEKLNVSLLSGTSSGGIYIGSGSAIASNGGAIQLTSQQGSSYNAIGLSSFHGGRGVYVNGSTIDASGGDIKIRGQGADGVDTSYGIDIGPGSTITTTGNGTINIHGAGGNSSGGTNAFSTGVNIGGGTEISATTGQYSYINVIDIEGNQAGTSTNPAYSISFDGASSAQSKIYDTHNAIFFDGFGGTIAFSTPAGSANVAIGWDGSGTATTGHVSFESSTVDLNSTNTVSVKGGSVTLTADNLPVSNTTTLTATSNSSYDSASGIVDIGPYTTGTTLGVGTGSGSLQITNAMLGQMQGDRVRLSTSGAVDVAGTIDTGSTALTINSSSNTLTLESGASLTSSSSASGTTGAILLNGGQVFSNLGATLHTPNSRWIIFSRNPANDTHGSLTGYERYSCHYASCSTIPTTGNTFAYTVAGTDTDPSNGGGGGGGGTTTNGTSTTVDSTGHDSSSLIRDITNIPPTVKQPTGTTGRIIALKDDGESLEEIKEKGYAPVYIKAAGFSVEDMLDAGYTIKEISSAGYTVIDMEKAGVPAGTLKDDGYSLKDLLTAGYSPEDLKKLGYPIADFMKAGDDEQKLRDAGFTNEEILASGLFDPETLRKDGMPLDVFVAEGYDPKKLISIGYTPTDLHGKGYKAKTLKDAGVTLTILKDSGYGLGDLEDAGYSPKDLKSVGYTAKDLKDTGDTVADLKKGGYTLDDLKDAGYSLDDLKGGGYTLAELKDDGYSLKDLKDSGYTFADLQNAGYSQDDLITVGYVPPPPPAPAPVPAPAPTVTDAKPSPSDSVSAAQKKAAGNSPLQLAREGYSFKDIADGGYTTADWKADGVDAATFKSYGGSAADAAMAGFTFDELIAGGYSVEDAGRATALTAPPSNAVKTKAALDAAVRSGKSPATLLSAGYSIAELLDEGFSLTNLINDPAAKPGQMITALEKNLGYNPAQLKMMGMAPSDFQTGNFPITDLKDAQFTGADLHKSGIPTAYAKAAGYSAGELAAGGYTLADLKAAGYPAADLRAFGSTAAQVKAVGYSASDIRAAGYSASEAKAAGFSLSDMAGAGYPPTELLAMGYSLGDIAAAATPGGNGKTASGYSTAGLRAAGDSAADLLAAGFSLADLRNGGYPPADLMPLLYDAALAAQQEEDHQHGASLLSRAAFDAEVSARQIGVLAALGYTDADLAPIRAQADQTFKTENAEIGQDMDLMSAHRRK